MNVEEEEVDEEAGVAFEEEEDEAEKVDEGGEGRITRGGRRGGGGGRRRRRLTEENIRKQRKNIKIFVLFPEFHYLRLFASVIGLKSKWPKITLHLYLALAFKTV